MYIYIHIHTYLYIYIYTHTWYTSVWSIDVTMGNQPTNLHQRDTGYHGYWDGNGDRTKSTPAGSVGWTSARSRC